MPLADRLVEVIATREELARSKYRYGSGFIVRGRTVLTAAHVVAGADTVKVRDRAKNLYPANVEARFVGDASGKGVDLALVEVDDERLSLPPIGLARVDRDSPTADPVERCHAIGYPWFAQTRSPQIVRETVDAIGFVPVGSGLVGGMLTLLVSVAPRALPPEKVSLGRSEWAGMSGAAVVAGGRLIGVVVEHAPRAGQSAITVAPLTALEHDPIHPEWGPGVSDPAAWWSRLGVTGMDQLKFLPAHPERPEPAYRSTLREYGRTLHARMPQLLGREKELADIASFATGSSGYRWLVGAAYAGKTALLYEAVMVGLPAEADAGVDVVSYFLSRRAADADSNRFLDAVVPQLAHLCEVDPPAPDRDQFNALWERAADRAAQNGRHLLLVVDGLDEDLRPSGSPSVASRLPTLVGNHAHVLVSSRPYPELPDDVFDHPLRETRSVQLKSFEGAAELVDRARNEIDRLARSDDSGLAREILGLLTAAAGPLSVRDLADLSSDGVESSTTHEFQVARLVTERAARSLEHVGPEKQPRFQFAHYSLLEYAHTNPDLGGPEFRNRIHRWAELWRDRDWPSSSDVTTPTPNYLLDSYPATLASEPDRLAALIEDAGWVNAAIQLLGAQRVLASAAATAPDNARVKAMLGTVRAQAHELSLSHPLTQSGYVPRQLWLQAATFGEDRLAEDFGVRLRSRSGSALIPLWTTRWTSPALVRELGHLPTAVEMMAALKDGRLASCGWSERVLLWDPALPEADPVELGRHDDTVWTVTTLSDGRLVSGDESGRLLLWDADSPAAEPVELGRHAGRVGAVAALSDERLVSVSPQDPRLLLWDAASPGAEPDELGLLEDEGRPVVAVLSDGQVVSGGWSGRLLLWNPTWPGAEPVEIGRTVAGAVVGLPDGRLISGGWDGRLLVWQPTTPGAEPVELTRYENPVSTLAVLDGGRLAGEGDGRLLLWDADAPGAEPVELGGHYGGVREVVVLPDGRIVSGGGEGSLLLWDLTTLSVERNKSRHQRVAVLGTGELPDGRLVGGEGGRVLIWDPEAPGVEPIELGRHDDKVEAVAVLSDGRPVSAGGHANRGGRDRHLLLWDPAVPRAIPVELGNHALMTAIAALPRSRLVSGDTNGRLLLWDANSPGDEPVEIGHHDGGVTAFAALTDERLVSVSLRDPRLLLWDANAAGAEPVEIGRHDDGVWEVAALPDGQLSSAGHDGRLLLWDVNAPGAEPVELSRHDGAGQALAALPDGRLASGWGDQVRLLDPTSAIEPAQLGCSAKAFWTRASNGAGALLVIAHADAGLSFWSVTSGS